METRIEIKFKDVYGNSTIYPENDSARMFAELLRQKTLTIRDLKIIQRMGFEIVSIPRTQDDILNDLIVRTA